MEEERPALRVSVIQRVAHDVFARFGPKPAIEWLRFSRRRGRGLGSGSRDPKAGHAKESSNVS
jgi:hypothetical protein